MNDCTDIIIARGVRLGEARKLEYYNICDRRRTIVEKPRHRGKKRPTWALGTSRHHYGQPLAAKQLEYLP